MESDIKNLNEGDESRTWMTPSQPNDEAFLQYSRSVSASIREPDCYSDLEREEPLFILDSTLNTVVG